MKRLKRKHLCTYALLACIVYHIGHKGGQISWIWSYGWLWAAWCECWNQAQVLHMSSKGLWLPSHHLSISTPISLLGHSPFHPFLCLDSLKKRQRYRRMIGWKAVADGGMLRETQPGRWSLVLFVQRRCSEDATPHFGVLAHWLFWTEDIWGTPDTEIVSPKCLFSTWRDLPPKCSQLLWILCPNLHTYQGRWTWVAGIKLGVDTMTITYSLITQIFFYSE